MNEHQQQPHQRQEPSTRPTGQSLPTGQSEATGLSAAQESREDISSGRQSEAMGLSAVQEPRADVSPVRTLLVRVRDTCRKPLQYVMHVRDATTVVQLSDDARSKVDALIDAGVFETRGVTTAFLIDEGIHAQESLFRDVEQKMREIESLQSELRSANHSHG